MARGGQSRPDSGLGFQVDVLEIFEVVSSSLGSFPLTSQRKAPVSDPVARREKFGSVARISGTD